MTPHRPSQIRLQRRLAVAWQDSVWFPPVLAEGRFRADSRRPVRWPTQIITDPTTCAARTLNVTQP
jgi:hypothetical protein